MSAGAPDLLTRLQEVEQRRRIESVAGLLTAVAVGQLFFAAFAFGHSQGPISMATGEVLMGMTGILFVSVVAASLLRRRRLERRAKGVLRVTEGRHRRRVALFDAHVTIDDEVVLLSAVRAVDLHDGRLVVRYVDPRASGPVLRELEGPSETLTRLVAALPVAEP